jgi:PAS domain S-box-containing protein
MIRVHQEYYKKIFENVVGHENVGWMAKDLSGHIVNADDSGRFARMVGLSQSELIGSTTADLPWSNLEENVRLADSLVRLGEVREMTVIYWHSLADEWRRVVGAKWLEKDASEDTDSTALLYCMVMDVSEFLGLGKKVFELDAGLVVDWEKEQITLKDDIISRADLVCLSYYLEHTGQAEIAKKMHVSLKTIERRLARVRQILLPMDKSCPNLYELCRKYGIRSALEEKRDWFDRLAVIRSISNGQWL